MAVNRRPTSPSPDFVKPQIAKGAPARPRPLSFPTYPVANPLAAAAKLGAEAGNVLRRKVAVRLRGGLRAGGRRGLDGAGV